jgi:PAS domain-containing protein
MKYVEGSIVLIREALNGKPMGFRGIIRDITERKDSQRMLEESQHRYKSLFDYNPDLVCSFGLDSKFVTINPATEKLTGFTSHQLMGRTCGHLLAAPSISTNVDTESSCRYDWFRLL